MNGLQILTGDCREVLPTLEAGSVQTCITSPPYWGLRSYLPNGHEDKTSELGSEATPEEYIAKMVAVFREVWRVLRDDGTCWINLGSSYASANTSANQSLRSSRGLAYGIDGKVQSDYPLSDSVYCDLCDECRAALSIRNFGNAQQISLTALCDETTIRDSEHQDYELAIGLREEPYVQASTNHESLQPLRGECSHCANCGACLSVLRSSSRDASLCVRKRAYKNDTALIKQPSVDRTSGREFSSLAHLYSAITDYKSKDLINMPFWLAEALRLDGWWLRQDLIWSKPNPMPESVSDRCTKAHEYIFLLTKNGGNPLIWRARDTGEWSYKPDLSEMLPASKKDLVGGGLSGWDTGPGAHTKLVGRYDLDEEDAIENESWKGSRFDKGKTAEHQLNRSQSAESRAEQEEVPRWKGFDYFYDAEAIREPVTGHEPGNKGIGEWNKIPPETRNGLSGCSTLHQKHIDGRNKRSVWTIATQPYAEAHFATFPEEIPKLCILAGSKPGDTVLDPFAGSGTVGKVALELGRRAILIELNPAYIELAKDRTFVTPGFL